MRTANAALATYIGVMACLLTVTIAVSAVYLFVPYSPTTTYSYNIQQEEVCPGESVTAIVDRKRESPLWADMDVLEASESFVTVDVPSYSEGRVLQTNEATVVNPEPVERSKVRSPAITEAPEIPGVYSVQVNNQIRGTQFGIIPRTEDIEYQVDDALRVVEPDSEQCEGGQ